MSTVNSVPRDGNNFRRPRPGLRTPGKSPACQPASSSSVTTCPATLVPRKAVADEATLLAAAAETAWLRYNAIAQALPDCEHTRVWKADMATARTEHLAALKALDDARADPEAGG